MLGHFIGTLSEIPVIHMCNAVYTSYTACRSVGYVVHELAIEPMVDNLVHAYIGHAILASHDHGHDHTLLSARGAFEFAIGLAGSFIFSYALENGIDPMTNTHSSLLGYSLFGTIGSYFVTAAVSGALVAASINIVPAIAAGAACEYSGLCPMISQKLESEMNHLIFMLGVIEEDIKDGPGCSH